jgi:hypothetical protein
MRLTDSLLGTLLASALLVSGVYPLRAETYTVAQWPQDIGKVPCEAWQKGGDGAWKQVAMIQAGSQTIQGKLFKAGSSEAVMLNAKCRR